MTTTQEALRSIAATLEFLKALPYPAHYPKIPKAIRKNVGDSISISMEIAKTQQETMPNRQIHLDNVRNFLYSLRNPKVTPRVPASVRRKAYDLLKHFPFNPL